MVTRRHSLILFYEKSSFNIDLVLYSFALNLASKALPKKSAFEQALTIIQSKIKILGSGILGWHLNQSSF